MSLHEKRAYNVDASNVSGAITRALNGFARQSVSDVDVSCRLFAKDIERHYSDPKLRAV